jgi:hypothetical protein
VNTRIKELEKQCWAHRIDGILVDGHLHFDAEKFTNLIVQDVLDILKDPRNYNRCVYTTFDASQAGAVAHELSKKIKEHFKDTQ